MEWKASRSVSRLLAMVCVAALSPLVFGHAAQAQEPSVVVAPSGPPGAPPATVTAPAPPPAPYGAYPPSPPPYNAYPPGPPVPMPPPQGPVVFLRADAPRARLQMQTQLRWVDVCAMPCGVVVNPGAAYRIGGGTVRPSDPFQLPPSGRVALDAQTGSTVKHWVGFGMLIGGLAGVGLGALVYSLGSSAGYSSNLDETNVSNDERTFLHVEGVVYMVIGAIVAAIGIPLMSSSTSVTVR